MSSKVSVQAASSQDAGPMTITASSVEATATTIDVLGTLIRRRCMGRAV
jgi:hypothetical protein